MQQAAAAEERATRETLRADRAEASASMAGHTHIYAITTQAITIQAMTIQSITMQAITIQAITKWSITI